MLIQFSFENFKSFKTESTLSLVAAERKENVNNLIEFDKTKLLRSIAVYGANAAGKSNLMKALFTAIMIIRTSASRQIDENIPFVENFLFTTDAKPVIAFEFEFIMKGTRYLYGFSCDRKKVSEEYLLIYKTAKPTTVFRRDEEIYSFTDPFYKKELSDFVTRNTPNKLFLATATAWNATSTKEAFLWFSQCIDVYDPTSPIPMLESYDKDVDGTLKIFTKQLLKESDINISDYRIETTETELATSSFLGQQIPSNNPVKQKNFRIFTDHKIKNGMEDNTYTLSLGEESKGTQNLFFLSPQIKRALDNGFVFCVDELDSSLHPALVLHLVDLFNNPRTNPNNAQLVLTTHTTELLSTDIMRRDQIYFVEKDKETGVSELYSLDEFSVRTREDIRKAYLSGRFGAIPDIM